MDVTYIANRFTHGTILKVSKVGGFVFGVGNPGNGLIEVRNDLPNVAQY